MTEICFIEAKPRIVATGAETTVRLAGGGSDTPYYKDGQHYLAGVVDMPRFKGAFGYDDNGWTGGTVPISAGLSFMPGDQATVAALIAHYWRDAPITIDAADESVVPVRRLTGNVADIANNDGTIALTLVDPSKRLDKPLLGTGFAGTGGIEGSAEATGLPKCRIWGRVFNVPGELLDKVNNIYVFGDPGFPFQAFDFVRDKGRDGPLTLVAWEGSVAATFAALQAAAAPQGGAAIAPSIACVKWWTVPAGPLTADIRGETTGGYAETVVSIAARLLAAAGGPAIINQAAADALRPAPCGICIASATDTVAQAIDRLFLGSSLYWVLQPDGTIRIGQWAWGAPVESLQAIFIGRERQLPPIKSRKVGYKRNHRVHGAGEISAAVIPAGDVAYEDGTPIEALKPAEGGAQSNKPPTDNSVVAPLELPEGTVWIAADGHLYRFGFRPWTSNGAPWTSNGEPWLGGGYSDAQDQAAVLAQELASAVTAQVARIASDNWLTAGEKAGLVLSHRAMIENHIALDAKALALGAAGAERTAATAAVNALNAFLVSLSPAWNDTTQDTPANGATLTTLWGAAAQKVALLQAAIQGLPGAPGTPGTPGAPGAPGTPGTDGVDGIDGTDGKLVEFVWKRAASIPAAPTGNGIPATWSDDPPAGADPLWMSKAKQELDGTLVAGETWSTPIRHNGTDGATGAPGISPVLAVASPTSKQFTADADGVVKTGQLAFPVTITATKAGAAIGGTVTILGVSGCTATAVSGGFTIDTVSADSGYVNWRFTATDGQTGEGRVSFSRQRDPTGGGQVLVNFSSTSWWGSGSYGASGPGTVLAASSAGKLKLTGYASFYCSTNGSATLTGKLQYRAVGSGTWIDAGISGSGVATRTIGVPGEPNDNTPGIIAINGTVTGLTADGSYEMQMVGNRSTSGTAISSATGYVSMQQVV